LATVVTVHGTYAHLAGAPDAPSPAELQWWQPDSPTEQHLRELIGAADGKLDFVPFTWSGENSERERREAGTDLLKLLRQLEERQESYSIVGHSHGGTVIADALVESVARNRPLEHLKRWITVGTPFVRLRKERFLFTRLTLTRQVVFVASLMLLMMFLFYAAGALFDGSGLGRRDGQLSRFAISAAAMSLPFIVFYAVLKFLDARKYFSYRPRLLEKARAMYADKWLPLVHEDDEAVQGLKLLPTINVSFFGRDFAAPMLTLIAIFVLPLAYLFIVTSPPTMVAITNLLKHQLYDVAEYQDESGPVTIAQQKMRSLRRQIRQARETAETSGLEPVKAENARQQVTALRKEIRDIRRSLMQIYPELPRIVRAHRFKRRFLERDGKPCEGGSLCGAGHNYALNSALLFHVVTDELSSAFVDENLRRGPLGGLLLLALPVLLVPIVFALFSLGMLVVIEFLARHVSSFLSRQLNGLTRHEITRQALGNDTDGEIAVGSDVGPRWVGVTYPFLPSDLGDKVTEYSNDVSFKSLAKFRNAISTLAFSDSQDAGQGVISTYLTWRELIHTAYFEVPEFRKLMAYAIVQGEGFAPTQAFAGDPDRERVSRWFAAVAPQPAA
jgi:hypothetical protein